MTEAATDQDDDSSSPFCSIHLRSFSSAGGVMLKAAMSQLERMDACLDTLTTELNKVNTHVGCIARRQVVMGCFTMSPSPSPSLQASEDEDVNDGSNDDDDDVDEDASSSDDEEMTASQ